MIPAAQKVTQNDYGYEIPFTLNDGNGNPVNITGASLALKVQYAQDNSTTDLTLGGSFTIVSGPAGTCYYTPANGDFPTAGIFNMQITATFSNEVLSWSGMQLIVMPALPQPLNS